MERLFLFLLPEEPAASDTRQRQTACGAEDRSIAPSRCKTFSGVDHDPTEAAVSRLSTRPGRYDRATVGGWPNELPTNNRLVAVISSWPDV